MRAFGQIELLKWALFHRGEEKKVEDIPLFGPSFHFYVQVSEKGVWGGGGAEVGERLSTCWDKGILSVLLGT